jgi:DNA-binding PadR family transcriptional regulator
MTEIVSPRIKVLLALHNERTGLSVSRIQEKISRFFGNDIGRTIEMTLARLENDCWVKARRGVKYDGLGQSRNIWRLTQRGETYMKNFLDVTRKVSSPNGS